MTIHRPENRSFADARSRLPLFERGYWTPSAPTVRDTDFPTRPVLIRFRTAEGDFQTLTDQDHVVAVQADQFRPSKAARKPYQQQCTIPDILEPLPHGFQHHKQVFLDQWGCLTLSRTFDPF